jgi:hypothetical protein
MIQSAASLHQELMSDSMTLIASSMAAELFQQNIANYIVLIFIYRFMSLKLTATAVATTARAAPPTTFQIR